MRIPICAALAVAIGLAVQPAGAQTSPAAFWKAVQANCDATAAKLPSDTAKRIAQSAIDEFKLFDGHEIDATGRLFHFGLTEAEHEEDDGGGRPQASLGRAGWQQVSKYWRVLFDNAPWDKLEVRGYRDASNFVPETQSELLRTSAARLLQAADAEQDPIQREVLREAAIRAAMIDTPWSAAFISYVIRQSGVAANAFQFSNAHRAYIYDAFAASVEELAKQAGDHLYRACPVATTKPRIGDLICEQREPTLADASDKDVRERLRQEIESKSSTRMLRRAHCEVVARVDAKARRMYTIGGNVAQSITARQLNLRRNLRFAVAQKGHCGGNNRWALELPSTTAPRQPTKCSLNDKKWFVLLQVR
ncbi:MAG TPA: DUF2272 domain-containing protein [Pseudolabrys sp.]